MRRGTRTVVKPCACGCGRPVPPYISPTSNRVEGYPKFIPGHGYRDWGRRWAQRLKENGHPQSKPIGSRQVRYDGYIKVKCADGRWQYEHRIATGALEGEVVHHVNENPSDNSPDNLLVMSPGAHISLHHTITRWSRHHDACLECNSTERPHMGRGLCSRCWQRARASKTS